jgi:hypothetical protein
MLYRFYESKTARKNHDHFSKINKNFGVSAEEYQKVFPNLNFISDEFKNIDSRNLAIKYNLKAMDILSYRQAGVNYGQVYIPKIKSSDINNYMNKYKNSNNLNVNCKKYNTTTESCGCPAFKYHPETKCKHINSYIQNQEVVKTEEVIDSQMNETNSETHMRINKYTNSNNLNVNCKKYNTTTESCGCPAFKYHPETKCKHINSYIQNQEVVKTEEVIDYQMNETNSETHMCMTQ